MTLLRVTLRSVLRGRRALVAVALPLLLAVFALVVRANAGQGERTDAYATLGGDLLVLVIALVALVLGVNAFGDEQDEGTLGLLLATTLPRWHIVLTKVAVAVGVTWVACLPATLACLALADSADLPLATAVWSLVLATALAAAAYVGVFVLMSLLLRRGVLIGLVYLVLWEGLLATRTTAFRNLSVGPYARRVAGAPFDDVPFATADGSLLLAVVVLVGLAAGATAAAAWRLPRTSV